MSNNKAKKAIIMGIWGRAGGDGIPGLIRELEPQLVALGVKAENVFSMSWNPKGNDDPTGKPDTKRHLKQIAKRESDPSFIALIGHSYGGWAASLLSRKLQPGPNLVGLIDPVFGPLGDSESRVAPHGLNLHNWYQRNSITEPTFVEDCTGTVVGCPNGVSCGRKINGVHNHKVKWQRKRNGEPKKRGCGIGEAKRHAYHTNIDSDRFIWQQITNLILADIKS